MPGRNLNCYLEAPGRAQLQRDIVREGQEELGGLSAWISVGLGLEEQQYVRRAYTYVLYLSIVTDVLSPPPRPRNPVL